MGLLHILLILIGWIGLKYALLGSTSFENSFLAGIIYNYTALIVIAFLTVFKEVKNRVNTPEYLDAFKLIASKVMLYSIGASLAISFWHHYFIQDITAKRLEDRIYERMNTFDNEDEFAVFIEEYPALKGISLEQWIEKEVQGLEMIFSTGIQTSLTIMAYLVIGLFISLIASFLWTKVWCTQQSIG